MNGTINVLAVDEGENTNVSIKCDLHDISGMDKFNLLHGICQSLHLDERDAEIFAVMFRAGVFNNTQEVEEVSELESAVEKLVSKILGGVDGESRRK